MKRNLTIGTILLFICTAVAGAVSPGVGGPPGKPPAPKPTPSPITVRNFIQELRDIGLRSESHDLPTPREIRDFIKQQPINTTLAIEGYLEKIGYTQYFKNVPARIIPSQAVTQFIKRLNIEGFKSTNQLPFPETITKFAEQQPYSTQKKIIREMEESGYTEYFRAVQKETRRVAVEAEYEKSAVDQRRLEEAEARAREDTLIGGVEKDRLVEIRNFDNRYFEGIKMALPENYTPMVDVKFLKDGLAQLYEFMKLHNINESVLYKRMVFFYQNEYGKLGMHRVQNFPGLWEFHLTKGDVLIFQEPASGSQTWKFLEVMKHDDFMSKYRK